MYLTPMSGNPLLIRCQLAPPSSDRAAPRDAVPAYTVPSAATTMLFTAPDTDKMVDSPLPERDHVAPPSCDKTTPSVSVPAYILPAGASWARLSIHGVVGPGCTDFHSDPSSELMNSP